MSEPAPLGLFEGFGVEIEYVIVDRTTLAVRPIADRLLKAAGGGDKAEVERGTMAWSNELMLHVIEFKTNGPVASLHGLAEAFQGEVEAANALLDPMGALLLPTGMHPTMDPGRESRIWPHEHNEIYRTFDRIFDCRGHGWANLQSTHLNISFGSDAEFARLHSAIRVALPLLPALAASSPIRDGRVGKELDGRLAVYKSNAARVRSVSGLVIPETAKSRAEYERKILQRIYNDLTLLDPQGVLRHEWVNARGAIARFDRGAIEVRVLDTQECPSMDLAILDVIVGLLRLLTSQDAAWHKAAGAIGEDELAVVLASAIADAEGGQVTSAALAGLMGWSGGEVTTGELWSFLVDRIAREDSSIDKSCARVRNVVTHGCLARRIRHAVVGRGASRNAVDEVYREVAACLAEGTMFAAS